jgi:hypothetical protein
MSFPARWKSLTAVSGNLNTLAAGTITATPALSTANIAAGTLSCLFVVEAETNTLTISPLWQVSDDNSTWYSVGPVNNAAVVVLATGTSGDDPVVSRVLSAPNEVLGWKYVRAAVVNLVAQGGAADTYSMTIHYRHFNGFS